MNLLKKSLISIILILGISLIMQNNSFAASTYDYTKLDDSKYPGIKALIQEVKKAYPNYSFVIYDTGLNWEDVINSEYQGHYNSPRNLVEPSDTRQGMWICPICTDTAYDSGRWRCASLEAIKYMMDPRNSINTSDVFQFEELGGSGSNNYTKDDIKKAVAGTFLNTSSVIDTIYYACKSNVPECEKHYDVTDAIFNSKLYYDANADLQKAIGNNSAKLKEHWLKYGIKEGRIGSFVFNAQYYIDNNEDVKKYCGNGADKYQKAYDHFITSGLYSKKKSSVFFDVQYYMDKYDDVYDVYQANPAKALMHYVQYGFKEGRIASAKFQLDAYKEQNKDVAKAYGKDTFKYFEHYVLFGQKEKRPCTYDKYKTVTPSKNRKDYSKVTNGDSSSDLNPLYLVSLILQEQGKNGSVLSLGNGYNGQYAGYYNLLNIGAYGGNKDKVILNGLAKAKSEGWTSPELAISGGIEFLKQSYIDKGQTSLYTQKFDVVGTKLAELFQHQYQQNVMAAQSEGTKLRTFYSQVGTLNSKHTFVIPVYNNMPKNTCSRPDYTVANTLNYENAKVNVNSSLSVRSSNSSNSFVLGSLSNGESVKILQRTNKKVDGVFRDIVISDKGYYGYATREEDGKTYLVTSGSSATTTKEAPTVSTSSNSGSNSNSNKSAEASTNNANLKINLTNYIFDSELYYKLYADVRQAFGNNPSLLKDHWLKYGIKEGRTPSLVYNPKYYLEQNADVKKAFGNNYTLVFNHFINYGAYEGRTSSEVFNGKDYMNKYKDIQDAFGKYSYSYGAKHFIEFGCKEGRVTSSKFNVTVYKSKNKDLQNAFGNKWKEYFMHYMIYGKNEKRQTT